MSEPTKLAVVGAGHLGRFHSKLAAQLDHFELVAVADPSTTQAEAVAEEAGTKAVSDYRTIIDQVDAVVVATPTVTHFPIIKDLLQSGLHVLAEKPLTPTLAEAEELVAIAEANHLTLQVGHVERFNPAMTLAEPVTRDPKFIRASRTSGYTFRSTDIGVVLDLMIHDIDLVLSLARSPVVDVSAIGVSVMGDHEDIATAQIRFESGCVAQLTASRVSYEAERTMQVFTTRGFASIDFTARSVSTVSPTDAILRREFDGSALTAEQRDSLKTQVFEKLLVKEESSVPAVNAIEEELKDFARAIRTGESPLVSGAAGRDAVAVAEQVIQQIARHEWDGSANGRTGAFVSPGMPVLPAVWQADEPLRKAS